MKAIACLLGAGQGRRFAGDVPKAFVELAGRPLLAHAVGSVDECPDVDGFLVAAPEGWEERAERLARSSDKSLGVVTGGQTREDSVRRSLAEVPEGFDAALCHDVARPLARPKLFSDVLAPLDRADGVVPVIPVPDTVKRLRDGVVEATVPREGLVLVQTPQAFRLGSLLAAHKEAVEAGRRGTDDAALLELAGFRVATVPGDPANLKITTPDDLRLAELLSDG